MASIITPNEIEAEYMTGIEIKNIDDAKNAAIQAVSSLSPNDLVSIVAFETEAKVVLSATPANDPNIANVINSLEDGSTLLITGKGHEEYQDLGKKRIFFSDASVNLIPFSLVSIEMIFFPI